MGFSLINIGFGNMAAAARVMAIISPESAPVKRMIQEARDNGELIDATYGRKTRAVLIGLSVPAFQGFIDSGLQPFFVFLYCHVLL